jgi:septum formation protein
VDEEPKKGELPRTLANRLAKAKAVAGRDLVRGSDDPASGKTFVLAADTVVAVGRRIMVKSQTYEQAEASLHKLSGRSHRVYTSVCLVTPDDIIRSRLVQTRVRFRRLNKQEIARYLASDEWRDKAGSYAIQGLAGAFVLKLSGSYTSVVGLPLVQTVGMLRGAGYPVYDGWS